MTVGDDDDDDDDDEEEDDDEEGSKTGIKKQRMYQVVHHSKYRQ